MTDTEILNDLLATLDDGAEEATMVGYNYAQLALRIRNQRKEHINPTLTVVGLQRLNERFTDQEWVAMLDRLHSHFSPREDVDRILKELEEQRKRLDAMDDFGDCAMSDIDQPPKRGRGRPKSTLRLILVPFRINESDHSKIPRNIDGKPDQEWIRKTIKAALEKLSH